MNFLEILFFDRKHGDFFAEAIVTRTEPLDTGPELMQILPSVRCARAALQNLAGRTCDNDAQSS